MSFPFPKPSFGRDTANNRKPSSIGAVYNNGAVVVMGAVSGRQTAMSGINPVEAERQSSRDVSSEPADAPVSPAASLAQSVDEDRKLTFDQIVAKYHPKVYNFILRLVGNHDDAEDLTLETFTNAFKAWDRFRGEARVSTWLHQIAYNNCKNRFKQKDRQREREPYSLDDTIGTDSGGELGREIADWRDAPERLLMDKELSVQIQKAVDALAPEYKSVLVLAQMEGLSYEEVAQVTGLTVPAVKTRLHRARNMMRRRLEPYYRGWTGRSDG